MGKQVGRALVAVVVVIGVVLGIMYLTGTLQMVTAPFRGQVQQTEKVNDGDYRIAAYDRFYEQCAAVQADEDRIGNLEAEKAGADADRRYQLDTTLTAVKNSRAEKVREYNADAKKAGTAGQFRSSDLPYEIDIEGKHTECGK